MAIPTKINVSALDFNDIKQSLKDFLRSQQIFNDYDFEGAAINVILDLLAYNTHYLAYYLNVAANEAFLDSASKRNSVVSIAKHLGYLPRSSRAATAYIDITANTTSSPLNITLSRYSLFTTTLDGTVYNFYTTEEYIQTSNNNFILSGCPFLLTRSCEE